MDAHKLSFNEIAEVLAGKTIHIIPYMHPDWAWCHNRIWHETRYAESIAENIDLTQSLPGYRFYIDCWRTLMVPFLERRPEKLAELQAAVRDGRAAVCGAFANVRPNMVDGEAFIRNMVLGRRLWLAAFPDADLSVSAEMVDVALGHPQMPQILRKGGFRYYRAGRPYELLARMGYPRHFHWEGLDGTSILLWWGQYGGITFPWNIEKIFIDNWEESAEAMYELELKYVTDTASSMNIDIHQGCDDSLPLRNFMGNEPIDLPGFMEKWNRTQTSHMRFSTPPEFFHALEVEPGIQTVKGTIDPCDVSYNVAWGGEAGLAAQRIRGGELLAAAERMAACAHLLNLLPWQDAEECWKDNLTASAHATQWLFFHDIDEMFRLARRPIDIAEEQLRQAGKALLRRIPLPRNAVGTAFNPFGHDVTAPLVFAVTCGQIDTLRLRDGNGDELPFQVVNTYGYQKYTWEYDVVVMLPIQSHGWNTVAAVEGRIDCREGGELVPLAAPEAVELGAGVAFELSNGLLRLDFADGDLRGIFDLTAGSPVMSGAKTPWNHVQYMRVDTGKGELHCGPITGRESARWHRAAITERGPVRWKVRLEGFIGKDAYTQEIVLHAGEKKVFFTTRMRCDGDLEGYVTFGVPGNGDTLWGGINFGAEKKDVLNQPYFAWDEPGRDGHRLRDGLFFAKDFAACRAGGFGVALCPRVGDRYFLFDREAGELNYIHMGTTQIDRADWERNVNEEMLYARGRHVFEDMLVIGGEEAPYEAIQNEAYAYRLSPVFVRPVFYTDYDAPLGLAGSMLAVDAENVQISAAFIEGGDLIVRLWECAGRETQATLALPVKASAARAEDLIGNPDLDARAIVDGGAVRVGIRPWEIMTLRCAFEGR